MANFDILKRYKLHILAGSIVLVLIGIFYYLNSNKVDATHTSPASNKGVFMNALLSFASGNPTSQSMTAQNVGQNTPSTTENPHDIMVDNWWKAVTKYLPSDIKTQLTECEASKRDRDILSLAFTLKCIFQNLFKTYTKKDEFVVEDLNIIYENDEYTQMLGMVAFFMIIGRMLNFGDFSIESNGNIKSFFSKGPRNSEKSKIIEINSNDNTIQLFSSLKEEFVRGRLSFLEKYPISTQNPKPTIIPPIEKISQFWVDINLDDKMDIKVFGKLVCVPLASSGKVTCQYCTRVSTQVNSQAIRS